MLAQGHVGGSCVHSEHSCTDRLIICTAIQGIPIQPPYQPRAKYLYFYRNVPRHAYANPTRLTQHRAS